jgi:hypothetical protein
MLRPTWEAPTQVKFWSPENRFCPAAVGVDPVWLSSGHVSDNIGALTRRYEGPHRRVIPSLVELVITPAARTLALSIAKGDPAARVRVGNDANAPTKPGTSDPLPGFDLDVDRGGNHSNVEVQSSQGKTLQPGDFGDAINHAAEKVVDDPNIPEGDRTKGPVEAALVETWPEPPRTLKVAHHHVDENGNTVMMMPNGHEVDQGNVFTRYLDILNGTGKGKDPSGVGKVDKLTVYDRSG